MANHGPSYGLSRELERKNQARFSIEEAREVLQWVEQVTGDNFERDPNEFQNALEVCEVLKDGIALCTLMNCLLEMSSKNGRPIFVKFHKNPRMPFHKMENISNYLDACKAYGVPEISCFQTVDLYENKQCYKVIECLRSLAAVAQSQLPHVEFPHWVVRMAHNQPRRFPEQVRRQGEAVIPLQYGTNKCASQKGMTPYGLARQINSAPATTAAIANHGDGSA